MSGLDRPQSLLLRLPPSLRERAENLAHEEGVSLNYLICRALRQWVQDAETDSAKQPETGPAGCT